MIGLCGTAHCEELKGKRKMRVIEMCCSLLCVFILPEGGAVVSLLTEEQRARVSPGESLQSFNFRSFKISTIKIILYM